MTKPSILDMLEGLQESSVEERTGKPLTPLAAEATVEQLQEHLSLRSSSRTPKVGEIVQLRPGFSLRRKELDNQPFIVTEVLREPRRCWEGETGSPFYGQNLQVRIGHFDDDRDFLQWWVDPCELMLYAMPKECADESEPIKKSVPLRKSEP